MQQQLTSRRPPAHAVDIARPTLSEETAMGSLNFSSGSGSAGDHAPASPAQAVTQIPTRRERSPARAEFTRQAPQGFSCLPQQFVRLAGAQCRMSADEVAFHNRAHQDGTRRAKAS
jgi:hypothetical protein